MEQISDITPFHRAVEPPPYHGSAISSARILSLRRDRSEPSLRRGESKQHRRTKQRATMWEVDLAWQQMLVVLFAATCFGVWKALHMLMMEEERERRGTHRIVSPLFEQYLEEAVTSGGGPRNPTTGDLPLRPPGVRAGSRQGTRTSASSAAPTRTGSTSRNKTRTSNMDNTRPPRPAFEPSLTSARSRVRQSSGPSEGQENQRNSRHSSEARREGAAARKQAGRAQGELTLPRGPTSLDLTPSQARILRQRRHLLWQGTDLESPHQHPPTSAAATVRAQRMRDKMCSRY